MKSTLFTMTVAALLGSTGCVTPAAVKDASTQHKTNLASVHGAVGMYRKSLGAYYDRLFGLQRDAYVAQHMTQFIHETAADQAAAMKRLNADSAKDFIAAGAEMVDQFDLWVLNFDFWMKQGGDTVAQKRDTMKATAVTLDTAAAKLGTEAAALEGEGKQEPAARKRRLQAQRQQAARNLREQAARSDEDLTSVWVAIELQKQQKLLDAQLNLLAAQVETMQEFHAKIDDFLAIDATIDGGKIAEAAAAGSKVDVSGLLGAGGK